MLAPAARARCRDASNFSIGVSAWPAGRALITDFLLTIDTQLSIEYHHPEIA
jgi:hypothetical protein